MIIFAWANVLNSC